MAGRFYNGRRVILGAALVLFVGMGVVAFLPSRTERLLKDPTLVATKVLDFPVMPTTTGTPSVRQRIQQAYYKAFPPRRGNYRFSAMTPRDCSIQGLLNQCHEVSGVQCFIDRHVASGSVVFGSTNALSGPEWVTAFTNAVQSGEVSWWDANKKDFRKDNPVFVAIDREAFLILPKERVEEYTKGRRSRRGAPGMTSRENQGL